MLGRAFFISFCIKLQVRAPSTPPVAEVRLALSITALIRAIQADGEEK